MIAFESYRELYRRSLARIAELEAMCATQAETIAGLNRLLDGVAVAIVGKTRLFADLPEMREEGKG